LPILPWCLHRHTSEDDIIVCSRFSAFTCKIISISRRRLHFMEYVWRKSIQYTTYIFLFVVFIERAVHISVFFMSRRK
jgi:hypothetical protein